MFRIFGVVAAATAFLAAPLGGGMADPLTFELCTMRMTEICAVLGRRDRVEPVVPDSRGELSGGGIRYIYDEVKYKGANARSVAVLYGHAEIRGQNLTDHRLFDRPALSIVSCDVDHRPFSVRAYRTRLGEPDLIMADPTESNLRVAVWQRGDVRYRASFDEGGVLRTMVDTAIGRILERLEVPLQSPGE